MFREVAPSPAAEQKPINVMGSVERPKSKKEKLQDEEKLQQREQELAKKREEIRNNTEFLKWREKIDAEAPQATTDLKQPNRYKPLERQLAAKTTERYGDVDRAYEQMQAFDAHKDVEKNILVHVQDVARRQLSIDLPVNEARTLVEQAIKRMLVENPLDVLKLKASIETANKIREEQRDLESEAARIRKNEKKAAKQTRQLVEQARKEQREKWPLFAPVMQLPGVKRVMSRDLVQREAVQKSVKEHINAQQEQLVQTQETLAAQQVDLFETIQTVSDVKDFIIRQSQNSIKNKLDREGLDLASLQEAHDQLHGLKSKQEKTPTEVDFTHNLHTDKNAQDELKNSIDITIHEKVNTAWEKSIGVEINEFIKSKELNQKSFEAFVKKLYELPRVGHMTGDTQKQFIYETLQDLLREENKTLTAIQKDLLQQALGKVTHITTSSEKPGKRGIFDKLNDEWAFGNENRTAALQENFKRHGLVLDTKTLKNQTDTAHMRNTLKALLGELEQEKPVKGEAAVLEQLKGVTIVPIKNLDVPIAYRKSDKHLMLDPDKNLSSQLFRYLQVMVRDERFTSPIPEVFVVSEKSVDKAIISESGNKSFEKDVIESGAKQFEALKKLGVQAIFDFSSNKFSLGQKQKVADLFQYIAEHEGTSQRLDGLVIRFKNEEPKKLSNLGGSRVIVFDIRKPKEALIQQFEQRLDLESRMRQSA
jgi:hypothetical protein